MLRQPFFNFSIFLFAILFCHNAELLIRALESHQGRVKVAINGERVYMIR